MSVWQPRNEHSRVEVADHKNKDECNLSLSLIRMEADVFDVLYYEQCANIIQDSD